MTRTLDHVVSQQVPLQVRALEAGYGKKSILRGIDIALAPGEGVALIGGNGAGKSTLLKAIAGLIPALAGEIAIGGARVTRLSIGERLQRGVSYLLQGGQVFVSLTVEESLRLAAECAGVAPSELSLVYELFPQLAAQRGRVCGLLSGGQRQSLAIAMVMVRKPLVLLLDEPTAGLSPEVVSRIFTAIDRFRKEQGTAVLLVEQRVREALEWADRAIILNAGKVVRETAEPRTWLVQAELDSLFRPNVSEAAAAALD